MKLLSKNYKENRKFYTSHIGGLTEVVNNDDIELYTYITPRGTPAIIAFAGKQSRPYFHKGFFTEADRDNKVAELIAGVNLRKQRKAERAAERKAETHSLKVGDILDQCWGYDQTNYDFYQVIRVVSDKSVELRHINAKRVDGGHFTEDLLVPIKDSFTTPRSDDDKSIYSGNPFVKRASKSNWVKLNSYSGASKWDGRPRAATNIMFGH